MKDNNQVENSAEQFTDYGVFKFLRSQDPKFSMWTASNATYSLIEWMQKMEEFAKLKVEEAANQFKVSLPSVTDIRKAAEEYAHEQHKNPHFPNTEQGIKYAKKDFIAGVEWLRSQEGKK